MRLSNRPRETTIMMKGSEFLRYVDQLNHDKNIPREVVFEAVEAAVRLAMEKFYGLLGLALIVVVVALVHSGHLHTALHESLHVGRQPPETWPSYFYFAIALLGAAMTPYEVFFFSSGAVEEGWAPADLMVNRMNVYIGFPLGGILSLALMAGAALYLYPRGIDVSRRDRAGLRAKASSWRVSRAARSDRSTTFCKNSRIIGSTPGSRRPSEA